MRLGDLVTRGLDRARQFVCGLHGHDSLLNFEAHRLSMQCMSCGYESPGWDLRRSDPEPPRTLRIVRDRRAA